MQIMLMKYSVIHEAQSFGPIAQTTLFFK